VNVEVDDGHGWTFKFMISMIDAILWVPGRSSVGIRKISRELCDESDDGTLLSHPLAASTNSPIFLREAEKNDVRQMLSSHDLVAL
jgi:hypothetical protein